MYKIEKNIPINPHGNAAYPFGSMQVGDSFYADKRRATAAAAASNYGKMHDMKFASRAEGTGVRIWRIA